VNVVVQALTHVKALRDFFMIQELGNFSELGFIFRRIQVLGAGLIRLYLSQAIWYTHPKDLELKGI
jgi:hypothetical protein